jgi:hypothetical protein
MGLYDSVRSRGGYQTYISELAHSERVMNLKLGSKIQIRRLAVRPEQCKYIVHKYGSASLLYRPVVFAPNQHNELAAVQARVLKATPIPDAPTMRQFLDWVRVHKKQLFRRSYGYKIKPLDFEDYLRGSGASASVKNILRSTRAVLDRRFGNRLEDSDIGINDSYHYTKRKSFVKVECNLYRSPRGKKDKAPRLIQGATPEFVSTLGPWFAALQRKIKRDWNANNFITYTSGISNLKLGTKLVNFHGMLAEDDVSAWDSSVSKQLCDFELEMARDWFLAPKAVCELMKSNISTHGVTQTGIKYRVPGTRKSGDPYTSLFNSVLNGLMHVWMIATHNGWSFETCEQRIVMYVQGDDNAMSVRGEYPDVQARMLALGFDAKFIRRDHYTQLEFCSMRIQGVAEGYTFGPKIGRILSKIGYYINPPLGISRQSLIKGTMLGLVNSCHHIPALMLFIQHQLRLCGDVVPYYSRIESWKTLGAKCTTTVQTKADLLVQTGLGPPLIHALEENFSRLTSFETDVDSPAYQFACDRDTGSIRM